MGANSAFSGQYLLGHRDIQYRELINSQQAERAHLMILTDKEVHLLRETLESQVGLDDELLLQCGSLLRNGSFDDAVRKAFVILEERLRKVADLDDQKMTGVQLANHVFRQEGWLGKQLGEQRDGLRELYSGTFKVFRNPTAHKSTSYDQLKGKTVVGLVNLLMVLLNEVQPNVILPENVENALAEIENDKAYGADIADKVRSFAIKCIRAGLVPQKAAKEWLPFRRRAKLKYPQWSSPKGAYMPMFYICIAPNEKGLRFPVYQYYAYVVGYDVEPLRKALKALGAQVSGKNKDYTIDLRPSKSHSFFHELAELVNRTAHDLDATLQD
jgi:hypothetical protein